MSLLHLGAVPFAAYGKKNNNRKIEQNYAAFCSIFTFSGELDVVGRAKSFF